MKITLDTNIIVQDFWLDSPNFRVFLDEFNIIPGTLYIPELVIDEAVNKYRERIVDKTREQKMLYNEISRLLKNETPLYPINIEIVTNKYKEFLFKKLKEIKATILPYPVIEHKKIVERILERKRPFKKNDSGYRDYLIWLTIKNLELWGTEEIVFITNNTTDFGETGYLSEEFKDKLTNNKNFKISISISKFNEDYIIPRLKKLDQLKLLLNKGQIQNFNFKDWLNSEFIELVKEIELEEVIAGFPYGVGTVKVKEILLFDDYEIISVSELETAEKLLGFSIKCKVNASIDVDWEDYVNFKEVRDFFGVSEEKSDSFYTMTSENIEVSGFFILDKQNQNVTSVEITLVDGPYGSIEMGI
jgi:predicted nucleic acid-binding protein